MFVQFLNVACNRLVELPCFLADMHKLVVIHAHGNLYSSPQLQIWQAQNSGYHLHGDGQAQVATGELKDAIRGLKSVQGGIF